MNKALLFLREDLRRFPAVGLQAQTGRCRGQPNAPRFSRLPALKEKFSFTDFLLASPEPSRGLSQVGSPRAAPCREQGQCRRGPRWRTRAAVTNPTARLGLPTEIRFLTLREAASLRRGRLPTPLSGAC